jgi:SAM-dependent methyltransferase
MLVNAESLQAEESRIQAAYARRKNTGLYSRFNAGHLFMAQERERRFLDLLARYGHASLATKTILEIGCGTGDLLRDLVKWGARPENMRGIDVLSERVSEAARLCPEAMRIQRGNAASLDFPDDCFDLLLQSTVFTSVLDPKIKTQMAREMLRVLKPDGLILWYDYHMDNPYNRDVRGVKRREIYELFPGCSIELRRITLAPPITRSIAPYSWLLCYFMAKIPLLCTHYIGAIRKSN